jgi:hypothetical protein
MSIESRRLIIDQVRIYRLDGENKEMRPVDIISIFTSDDRSIECSLLAPEAKEATLGE